MEKSYQHASRNMGRGDVDYSMSDTVSLRVNEVSDHLLTILTSCSCHPSIQAESSLPIMSCYLIFSLSNKLITALLYIIHALKLFKSLYIPFCHCKYFSCWRGSKKWSEIYVSHELLSLKKTLSNLIAVHLFLILIIRN